MKKKIDWMNHLIELIVVFIGITAAFLLNNWREDIKDRQLEEKYLAGFYTDIRADSVDLAQIIPANEIAMARAIRYIEAIKQGSIPHADSALILLGNMVAVHSFVQKRTTYESIRNSTNLNLISDYDLREKLISYYENYADVQTKEGVFFDWLNVFVMPFVYQNMDMIGQKLQTENAVRTMEFQNLVAGYYVLLQQNIETYRQMSDVNEGLHRYLTE